MYLLISSLHILFTYIIYILSANCECGAFEQTADYVLTACPIHRAPHGARGLTVLNDKTQSWLNNITASI